MSAASDRRAAILREVAAIEAQAGMSEVGVLPYHVRYFRGERTEELVLRASSLEMIATDMRRLADVGALRASEPRRQRRYWLTDVGREQIERDQR